MSFLRSFSPTPLLHLHLLLSFTSCVLCGFPAVALVTVGRAQQCLDTATGCTHSCRQQTPPPIAWSPSVWLCVQISQGIRLPCLNCALLLFYFHLLSLSLFLRLEAFLEIQSPRPLSSQHKHLPSSSKMPRLRINGKVTLALAPTPPTLSWRLNCDKTLLFLQRRGEDDRGGKKIRDKATRGKEGQRGERCKKRKKG